MSIRVSDLAYAYPSGNELFFDVNFSVGVGEHVGLVGANGVGKSTLMRIIAGELDATDGSVQIDGSVAYMAQDVGHNSTMTVRELLLNFASPDLRSAGRRVVDAERRLIEGDDSAGMDLGEAISDWSSVGGYQLEGQWDASIRRVVRGTLDIVGERRASELSGGEVKQLVLDVALSSSANVVLLDEPDNYLDIPAKIRLEENLSKSKKTIFLISHDRQLLSAVTHKVITLESSGAWVHGGTYATYADARGQRLKLIGDELKRWREEERRLFLHVKMMKQRAKISPKLAAAANAAESRWKRFVDAGEPPAPVQVEQIAVRLRGGDSGRRVTVANDAALGELIRPFDLEVSQGERIGVIGPNGSGKSHLLRLLGGIETPTNGVITLGSRVSSGLFTQTNSRFDFAGAVVEELVTRLSGSYEASMKILARYGLQRQTRNVYDTLSGGQKARLEILYLELEGHNFLLLDEPTDNLDIDSSEALEEALDGFDGTCVSVSHDRSYLESQDRYVFLRHDGSIFELLGYEDALEAVVSSKFGRNAKLLTTTS